jgi:hypothetical protein
MPDQDYGSGWVLSKDEKESARRILRALEAEAETMSPPGTAGCPNCADKAPSRRLAVYFRELAHGIRLDMFA